MHNFLKIFVLLAISTSATGGDIRLAAGVASDEVFRGLSQLRSRLIPHARLSYVPADSGFNAHLRAAPVDSRSGKKAALTTRAGYRFRWLERIELSSDLIYYAYATGDLSNYQELALSAGLWNITVSASFTDSLGGYNAAVTDNDSNKAIYWDAQYALPFGKGFTATAHWGHQKVPDGDTFDDWRLGLSWRRPDYIIELQSASAYDLDESPEIAPPLHQDDGPHTWLSFTWLWQ